MSDPGIVAIPAHDGGGHAVRGVAAYDVEMIAITSAQERSISGPPLHAHSLARSTASPGK